MACDDDNSLLKHIQKKTMSSLKLRGVCKACRILSVMEMDGEADIEEISFGVVIETNIPQTRTADMRRIEE